MRDKFEQFILDFMLAILFFCLLAVGWSLVGAVAEAGSWFEFIQ